MALNSPGQNTGLLFPWIFPTQGSNPGLPHCRQILYQLSHKEAQEYWSGIFPTQESNQGPLHCRQILYQLRYQGSPNSSSGRGNSSRDCLQIPPATHPSLMAHPADFRRASLHNHLSPILKSLHLPSPCVCVYIYMSLCRHVCIYVYIYVCTHTPCWLRFARES